MVSQSASVCTPITTGSGSAARAVTSETTNIRLHSQALRIIRTSLAADCNDRPHFIVVLCDSDQTGRSPLTVTRCMTRRCPW